MSDQSEPIFLAQQRAAAPVLFGDPNILHKENLAEVEQTVLDSLGTQAQAKAAAAEVLPILSRYTSNAADGKSLATAFSQVLRKAPDAEQVSKWEAASRQLLRDEYGAGAGEALAKAVAMVKADPALAKRLSQNGLGNHPSVMKVLAKRANGR